MEVALQTPLSVSQPSHDNLCMLSGIKLGKSNFSTISQIVIVYDSTSTHQQHINTLPDTLHVIQD